jgi:hypothetical protein
VADPDEGVAADGTIRTGARRDRVPAAFAPVLADAVVSVRDHTWTTSRARAVRRWSRLEPGLAAQLGQLYSWAERERRPAPEEVGRALTGEGIVRAIVERFDSLIGLW